MELRRSVWVWWQELQKTWAVFRGDDVIVQTQFSGIIAIPQASCMSEDTSKEV